MKLTVIENNSNSRWHETVKFNIWISRKNINKSSYSKIIDRRKLIIALANSDRLLLLEESIIIMKHIVSIIAIVYYEKECEIELIVGETLGNSDRISFVVSTFELIKLLKDL